MKKITILLAIGMVFFACKQTTKEDKNSIEIIEVDSSKDSITNESKTKFNIENIPYSNADLGDFPFFTLPKGLKSLNKPLQKNFDICFFPIDGIMTPFEGKLYKIFVSAEQGEQFSKRYFEKSMEDYLISIGAVKVFDGEIGREEYDRYNKEDPNKGDEGDMGYAEENIKFYVIRSKEKGNIYIQFSANNEGGKLNILQEESLKQTITKVSAADIVKDLTEKGKSILYINFDVDRSTVKPEGNEVITQIAEALKKDPNLKISIEGHTDNSGEATHNKKLSTDRANAVMSILIKQNIDKSRLSANGYGAEKPLVANDSEDNKARNRRVELVKTN
ncbi:OmpA family protein [Empedobacter tilapiae]|uniref:OmpA family protein n=1 Tax=Empedobacter tilapiae TaxID=2491114 RepID=A0A4Z1BWU0_9FLAO|nr:OmpA family protein [Empedobacter tilapiae]TGN28002.1 OmpA family protein [Empedobacter tilapiae]